MPLEKTIEQLQLELSGALAATAKLQQEISDVLAVNESLTAEIETLSKKKMCNCKDKNNSPSTANNNTAGYSFTLNGKKYGFNFNKLQYKRQLITALEVCASPELQQELVSSSSGMIKEII